MIERILYAADLGLYSPYVMKQIAELALSTNAKVDLLHVVEPLGLFAESILSSYISEGERHHFHRYGLNQMLDNIKNQIIEALDTEYKKIFEGVELVNVRVEQGRPAQVIIDQALELQADILVVGSHSQYSLESPSLGSTATKVVQTSRVPVLVIPMVDLGGLDRTT